MGQIAQTYACQNPPLTLPNGLAVAPDGRVYVADGVHNRIVAFDAAGEVAATWTTIGDTPLANPLGLACDAQGLVYVAEHGARRVLVLRPDGSLEHEYVLPRDGPEYPLDLTDVTPTPDGRALWVVDNENHRLLEVERATGVVRSVGRGGISLGQFEFPFSIAAAPSGDLLVSDVLNGRVQLLTSAGVPMAAIGAYGLEPGELYRPKGVAADATGHVWVTDSVLGVVQAFTSRGEFLGVLNGADGQPLRFAGPIDVAFGPDGALYVLELDAGRVAKVTLTKSDAPDARRPPAPRVAVGSGQQAKSCTVCHLDWSPEFQGGAGVGTLIARPSGAADEPYASKSGVCLSCHDGSVVDSRREVWLDHGHATQVAPPASMTVPPQLPLVDGKLACRTCHSAHGPGAAMGDIRKAVMLRVDNTVSQLCKSCHTDKVGGPRFGTHPTGGMPWPVPENLIEAGAKVGPDPRELTCQVCHTPHGAHNDHLLVLGTNNNQLCLSCHERMRPGMFRDGEHSEHPLMAVVNAEQAHAVETMGTKLGEGGQLICLSCHKLHHGKGDRFLLAADLNEGQMCLSCHSERSAMAGSAHDLRTNFPDERNRLGLTPSTGGPCSACHLFHRYARELAPGPSDATGHCLSCHRDRALAAHKGIGAWNHPGQRCEDCHDPHETRFTHFLRNQPEQLCSSCHADQAGLAGGPHDPLGGNDAAWADLGLRATDRCLTCHSPHSPAVNGPFRVARGESTDDVCLACHPSAGDGGQHAALHARTASAGSSDVAAALAHWTNVDLPLATDAAGAAQIACRTCHDPHGGAAHAQPLLRAPAGVGEQLCLTCHSAQSGIMQTAHAPQRLSAAGFDAQACGPCHRLHGPADSVRNQLLTMVIPGATGPGTHAAGAAADAAMHYVADPDCVACHSAGGGAPLRPIASHPRVAMFDPGPLGAAGEMPLYGPDGLIDDHGDIACRTCHLPHGRPLGPADEYLTQRPQLRPFIAPNTCTMCHGADGLRRYLYFHDPLRRGKDWAGR